MKAAKKDKFYLVIGIFALVLIALITMIFVVASQRTNIGKLNEQIGQLTQEITQKQDMTQENNDLKQQINDMQQQIDSLMLAKQAISGSIEEKVAYLTFDDGPSNNTEQILNTLKQYNVKATFFITGKDNDYYRGLYQRMIDEGHVIAPHTYTHQYSSIYSSLESFIDDQTKLMNLIADVGAPNPYIMRLPGGSNTTMPKKYGYDGLMNDILKHYVKNGYKYFDWNVDSKDSAGSQILTSDQIASNVVTASKKLKSPIVLMHDAPARKTTPGALPQIISQLKSAGYSFGVLTKDTKAVMQKKIV